MEATSVSTAQRDLPRCSEDRPMAPVASACYVRQQLPVVQAGGGGARFGGAAAGGSSKGYPGVGWEVCCSLQPPGTGASPTLANCLQ